MLVKEIKKNFIVSTENRGKSWFVFSKNERGVYNVNKYLCNINKIKRGVYCVDAPDFKPTKDIIPLLCDVQKHVSSLKYNSEFYNPQYRDGYFEEMAVNDYMFNIGFKSGDFVSFYMERQDIYSGERKVINISIEGLSSLGGVSRTSENVKIKMYLSDYTWVSSKCKRNPDDIIEHVNSMLKPHFLANSIADFKKQNEFKMSNVDIDINNFSMSSMKIQKKPYKEELIASLEEMLKELKSK